MKIHKHVHHLSIEAGEAPFDLPVSRGITAGEGGPHGYFVERGEQPILNSPGGHWSANAGLLPLITDEAIRQGVPLEVNVHAPGIAQPLAVIGGLGTLQTVCNDENGAAGKENAITSIVFNNTSGAQLNVARRVGVNDGATTVAENGTQTVIAIGGANTFTIHIEGGNHNAIIQGGARQQGTNSPAALCAVYGVVMDIQP